MTYPKAQNETLKKFPVPCSPNKLHILFPHSHPRMKRVDPWLSFLSFPIPFIPVGAHPTLPTLLGITGQL